MGSNEARFGATISIWLAFTVVAVTAMIRDLRVDDFTGMFLALLMVVGAVLATRFIWQTPALDEAEPTTKSKRRTRVDRMVERLSQQELEELRARLMAESDREQVSLDELMRYREQG